MFLVRYFVYSFNFKNIFKRVDEKMWKVIIYFLLLSMISLFPMNYLIVKEQGWRLDFIEQSFTITPNWELPENCGITANQLSCTTNIEYEYFHEGIIYIFNYQGNDYDLNKKQILFESNQIVYTNGEGARMIGYDYKGFEGPVNFREINLKSGQEKIDAYLAFGQSIENSFSNYIVIYALLVNTLINMSLYILFFVLLSFVLQLFRFGYSKFFRYIDSLKFLVFIMGVPAMLSFLVGFVEPAFSPVFFQFGMGLITMVVMLVYGKKEFA
ncbi:DUF1189 family protein [Peloplasma aerotolerans]|uniref:DUF1189 family protein n=1 Tax=Peloplasma aerotolerans TaxID=3044389 RepID=A0AAW6UDZ8_9MOLU|nr:DUF1189 family protein [Mariniplasma sp. M4Ah]MDI6453223.1 DUF1189 family protein [Mariniplasma sp. M4Ah]